MRCGAPIRLGNIQADLQLGGIWRAGNSLSAPTIGFLISLLKTSPPNSRLQLDTMSPPHQQSSQDLSTLVLTTRLSLMR